MADKSKLGTILVQSQMITPEDVNRALDEQKRLGIRFGEALVALGIIEKEDVGWGLSNQLNVPFIRLATASVDSEAVKLVPEPLARRHHLLPFLRIEDELTVVIEDPLNQRAIAEVEAVSGCKVNVCIGMGEEIGKKIDEVYGTTATEMHDISELVTSVFTEDELERIGADFSGEVFLRLLLDKMIERQAKAIYFEPRPGVVTVRFRSIAGPEKIAEISQGWFLVLSNRLKSLLDHIETRKNLVEGFLNHPYNGSGYLFYTSIVAAKSGNSITLLNLTPVEFPGGFDLLPLTDEIKERLLRIIGGRSGLAIVVGNDRIEKLAFTNLLLQKKHAEMKKTFAIGAMPWFADSGYMQISVKMEDRLEVLEGLKVAATQDPDILFVEDIWDRRVMQFALQTALSKTFIFSTLDFPDTLSALEYVNECIENKTLLTNALRGFIALYIFRTLCPRCKIVDTESADIARTLKRNRDEIAGREIFTAVGCEHCRGTGYAGHTILAEPLEIGEELTTMLKAGHKFKTVQEWLTGQGHRTLEQQAADLVLNGVIGINDFKNVERR